MEFLREVAEIFYEKERHNISKYCFVFPNRRSSLFFQKYLGEISSGPVFSPILLTINELFSYLSTLKQENNLTILYTLYNIYRSKSGSPETFDEFYNWGDTILNDFGDIDKYLVDARRLFSNIKDLREIDNGYDYLSEEQLEAINLFWKNFIPYSDQEKGRFFLSLWNTLNDIYEELNSTLRNKGTGYEGMIYREVAESSPQSIMKKLSPYKKIVFVGLNALNECEKKLLRTLQKEGIADFYWDFYGEMINDKSNRASLFMKGNVKDFPSEYTLVKSVLQVENQLFEVIGVPSGVGQAKLLPELLHNSEEVTNSDMFNTAVILPDEKLLFPVLNSIPEAIEKINVTMGYSLSDSNIYSFLNLITSLQTRVKISSGKNYFYHADVISILRHPLLSFMKEKNELLSHIIKTNMIFISEEEFIGQKSLIVKKIFVALEKSASVERIAEYQKEILFEIYRYVDQPEEREFINHYVKQINMLITLNVPLEFKTYFRVLKSMVSSLIIPFRGEPLAGLQIMGPLETRALDFENVIVMSTNEGVFPSRNVSNSLVPYNLRKGFGLPTYEYQDAVWAYYFYRMIYRAKRVVLIYDTRTEGLTTGEMSRYIMQLKYHFRIDIKERVASYKVKSEDKKLITIEKNRPLLTKMNDLFFEGERVSSLSATSINTYLDCSLRFYYQYIERLKESDQIVEEVEADTFGSIFHRVMEMIYSDYKGQTVTEQILKDIIADTSGLENKILKSMSELMNIRTVEGRNRIIFELIKRYAELVLIHDSEYVPFTYIDSEKRMNGKILLGDGREVNLYGLIDRIDKVGNRYRLIDYKTGYTDLAYKEIAELFDRDKDKRSSIALQMLLYLLKGGYASEESDAVVYSLRKIKDHGVDILSVSPESVDEFELLMKQTIEQIFDSTVPFKQNANQKKCEYCPYKRICL